MADYLQAAPPECAEAPKLCAACGKPATARVTLDHARYDICDACDRIQRGTLRLKLNLAARRSQLTPTPGSGDNSCSKCGAKHSNGPSTLCNGCANEESAQFGTPPPPTCSECKAPAVLNSGDLCGYCCYRLGHNETYIMWANHGSVANTLARHRREAIEQKRPRVNAAERAMLERGHPSFWPSMGDEEP